MKFCYLFACIALATSAAASAAPNEPDARMKAVLNNVLLLHVDGSSSTPLFFQPDGSVYYVYLSLKLDELQANYSQTVTWKRRGDEVCMIKAADLMTCFDLPQLALGEAADTKVRAVDQAGNIKWQESAKIMLVKGRPANAQSALTSTNFRQNP